MRWNNSLRTLRTFICSSFETLLVEAVEAIEEGAIERRHANGRDRNFFDEMHPRAHARTLDKIGRHHFLLRILLVEIFADDARLDDGTPSSTSVGTDCIRIERDIVRFQLILLGKVELDVIELEPLSCSTSRTFWLQVE